jgi:hypothetical protein
MFAKRLEVLTLSIRHRSPTPSIVDVRTKEDNAYRPPWHRPEQIAATGWLGRAAGNTQLHLTNGVTRRALRALAAQAVKGAAWEERGNASGAS